MDKISPLHTITLSRISLEVTTAHLFFQTPCSSENRSYSPTHLDQSYPILRSLSLSPEIRMSRSVHMPYPPPQSAYQYGYAPQQAANIQCPQTQSPYAQYYAQQHYAPPAVIQQHYAQNNAAYLQQAAYLKCQRRLMSEQKDSQKDQARDEAEEEEDDQEQEEPSPSSSSTLSPGSTATAPDTRYATPPPSLHSPPPSLLILPQLDMGLPPTPLFRATHLVPPQSGPRPPCENLPRGAHHPEIRLRASGVPSERGSGFYEEG